MSILPPDPPRTSTQRANVPKIGGLCFGYGGLDLAVQSVIPDAHLAWYAEFDKGASKIGAHRWPEVPNHGDMTKIDWAAVEPVDILTGGTPCQDLSHAGKRAGMTEGTRSNLWVAMREAIAQIRPSLVVWENVGGAASAAADSEVEPCAGCVGDGSGVHLRALGRVVGDLSSLGYVGQVRSLRAADVGAPHGRLRYFVVSYPEHGELSRQPVVQFGAAAPAGSSRVDSRRTPLLPSPRTSDTNGAGAHGEGGLDLRTAVALLPTPMVGSSSPAAHGQISGQWREQMAEALANWGQYSAAIHRWETLTRPAPSPTEIGPKGNPRLSAAFSEWMMGLPFGWVTDVPGITRNEALKALGNGVVPQQAAAALTDMLAVSEVAA